MMKTQQEQYYQKLSAGALLAMAAGSIDAYSYLRDGGVFAGLQTGNMILMGLHLGTGKYEAAMGELFSVFMFMVGIFIIRSLQLRFPAEKELRRKQITLAWEILIFVIVAFIPMGVSPLIKTAFLSVAAAAQLQEFRLLKGKPFTSLMMTGHIRTLSESIFDFVANRDTKAGKIAGRTITIILFFAIGAFLSGFAMAFIAGKAILIPAVILLIAFFFAK
ncbi:YoaK family protein [Lentilactobacillus sp. Marseille-Q4993]|uniref:YoaK family protein n=1 Tax=Lentilactobacillus sp. Marseille-Q4993 TaxID=3039492 RepID=UPI0024BCAE12|nr:YoaK family protein [Lentilactobacillus sp. Marseille-Q4993]